MSRLSIPAGERGQVRIIAIDLPSEEAAQLAARPERLAAGLGVRQLDLSYVDLIEIKALTGVGLYGYLQEGIDIAPAALEAARPEIEAQTGYVAVILSKAFGGMGVETELAPPLRLIAALPEAQADHNAGDLGYEATPEPAPQKPPKSEAAISGMIATYVLLAIFIFTGLLVWFSG